MGQGNLERVYRVRHHSSQDSSEGSSNIGPKSQWVHLLKLKNSHTHKRGQCGSSNGRTLNNNGNSHSNDHSKVSVDISGLVDDTGRGSEKHLLEKGNKSDEARNEEYQRQEQADTSSHFVIVLVSTILEESGAISGRLVTANKSDFAVRCVDSSVALGGVIFVAAFCLSSGNILDNILIGNDDLVTKRGHNLLDGAFPLLLFTGNFIRKHGLGKVKEVAGDDLEREENGNSKEVEHVVHSRTSKGTL
mmetsp:Transcript_19156/g.34745  ORF Transcript_19156/g.34745 Transcript_19156/m.34745 type:complete len:247 (+) Transcript_19156:599-1339(+)